MKIAELTPYTFAPRCKVPALFVHGFEDEFVLMENTEKNFEAYGADDKDVTYCEGGHNDERPKETIDYIIGFLKKSLL